MSENKHNNKLKLILLALFLLIALIASASFVTIQAYNLPEMGSSTDITLTHNNEKLLGDAIFHDISKQLPLVTDPYLQNYIQQLGEKLLKNSNSHFENFHFFIVDSSLINAFALPGGYIGVNKGLITTADSESEVASVLAHEISHVNQRHIARSFEKSQQVQMPMIAGIIAGALLSAYSPELGQSIIAGSMAAGNQMLINYTREHEAEADRIGINTLVKSGYPPRSMIDFFNKLQSHTRIDPNLFPEYLRTHPLTENRIADVRGRIEQIERNQQQKKPYNHQTAVSFTDENINDFDLVKNILVINSTENFIKTTNRNIKSSKMPNLTNKQINQYKFNTAYALLKQHKYLEANNILNELHKIYPHNLLIASLFATSYENNTRQAMSVLENQLRKNPNNVPLNIQYSKTAINTDYINSAIKHLKKLSTEHTKNYPEINLLLANAYDKTGKKWHASIAYADYSVKKGDYESAIMQLKASTKFDSLSSYQKKVTDYKIKQLEQEFEARKKKIKELL